MKTFEHPDQGEDKEASDYTTKADSYRSRYETDDDRRIEEDDQRLEEYAELVNEYYDLVTDFYEYGWGKSFHFAPWKRGESLEDSILRYEKFFAERLGAGAGDLVLDVGCGVGGPMMNIAGFSGATIRGLNNNQYQIDKGTRYVEEAGLSDQCSFVKGDFMAMPFEDNTFDAVYSIEAICHAPSKPGILGELFRVLKPGGRLCASDWCLNENFDPADPEMKEKRIDLETGCGLPTLFTVSELNAAIKESGFVQRESRDLAHASETEIPWFYPLIGRPRSVINFLRSPAGRRVVAKFLGVLEAIRVVPKGTVLVHRLLGKGSDGLIAAGQADFFTPLHYFEAEKPA